MLLIFLKIFGIICTFNIEDLVDYKGPDFNPSNAVDDEPSPEPISETFSFTTSEYFTQYSGSD